jgi:hypothetical protein
MLLNTRSRFGEYWLKYAHFLIPIINQRVFLSYIKRRTKIFWWAEKLLSGTVFFFSYEPPDRLFFSSCPKKEWKNTRTNRQKRGKIKAEFVFLVLYSIRNRKNLVPPSFLLAEILQIGVWRIIAYGTKRDEISWEEILLNGRMLLKTRSHYDEYWRRYRPFFFHIWA